MKTKIYVYLFILFLFFNGCSTNDTIPVVEDKQFRFVVLSDTHVTEDSDTITEMIPFILRDGAELVLHCGDLLQGGKRATAETLRAEFGLWKEYFKPLIDKGVKIYAVRGNHEEDAADNIAVWNEFFSGTLQLPQNGSDREKNLSYSFTHNDVLFVGLDTYVDVHKVNLSWLDKQLSESKSQHKFVFGHEAAFKVFHADCLDDYVDSRDLFWESMTNNGVKAYFCGHDHFYDATLIDNGDRQPDNDVYQLVVGGGGGWLMSKYNHNGENSYFTPKAVEHRQEHGYLLVEIDGSQVTMTWKGRAEVSGKVEYRPSANIIKYSI